MNTSHALSAAFLAAFLLVAGWCAAARADFTPGQCVTINGVPSHIIGPSPTVPGLIMAQGDQQGAGIYAWRPDQIQPAACPGPRVVKASCFESEPDSDGRTPLEIEVRGALRRELAKENERFTVRFDDLAVEKPRAWTDEETVDFKDGDTTKAIVSVQADYETCDDDGDYVTVVRRQRDFRCFVSAIDGQVMCIIVAGLGGDATIQKTPKY